MSKHEITVETAQAGETVAAVVRGLLEVPWSRAKSLCQSGRVLLDGDVESDPARRVSAGQRLTVDPEAERTRRGVLPKDSLLYLDDDVVVVAKPAGMLTVPYAETDRDTLADQTRAALKRTMSKRQRGRDPLVGVVQRLDKDTTGVLVFARTTAAKHSLKEQLRAHTVGRRYLAIVHGAAPTASYETMVVQDRGDGLRGSWGTRPGQHRGPPPADAKRCVTHTRALTSLRGATLLECRLETGRQHQIRIHVSEAGHPLVGEAVYIRDYQGTRIQAPRPMLHATELIFDHPRTGIRVRFELPPPADFVKMQRRLGG